MAARLLKWDRLTIVRVKAMRDQTVRRHAEETRQLAKALSAWNGRREVASALRVSLSTIYRWLGEDLSVPSLDRRVVYERGYPDLARLIALCRSRGIPLNDSVYLLAFGRHKKANRPSEQNRTKLPDTSVPIHADVMLKDTVKYVSQEVRYRLQLVRDAIDEQYFARMGCDEFARVAKMSKYNLINRFTAIYGVSPYRYLLQVRLAHAKQMLRSSDVAIGAVAIAVGFDSPSSLSKAFKNFEGVSLKSFCRELSGALRIQRASPVVDASNNIHAK